MRVLEEGTHAAQDVIAAARGGHRAKRRVARLAGFYKAHDRFLDAGGAGAQQASSGATFPRRLAGAEVCER